MSIVFAPRSVHATENGIPLLVNGDRMKQPEFHQRYLAYPEDEKWELIGGIVYMASPLSLTHSHYDGEIGYVLGMYRRATPGMQVLHNATAILGEESEPQPDLGLRILPEYGANRAQATTTWKGRPNCWWKSLTAVEPLTCTRNATTTSELGLLSISSSARKNEKFTGSTPPPVGPSNRTARASHARASFRDCGSTRPRSCAAIPHA